MSSSSLFLFGLEPPADDERRWFECELIPGIGSSPAGEFAVRVTPPVLSDGIEFEDLMLRGRWVGEPYVSDDLSEVDLGPTGGAPVYLNPLHGGSSSFQPFLGIISDHLPDHEEHGGYWQWFCDSMNSFVAREGHAEVPEGHIEDGFELGRYVRKLRREHDYGTLTAEKRDFFDSLTGWTWADSPSSAVIRFTTALREGDVARVESLLCRRTTKAARVDLDRPSSLGDLASFYGAWVAYSSKAPLTSISERSATQDVATGTEETGSEAEVASTEVHFQGADDIEVWTLHTVLEDDRWKVCSAHFRDQYPYDPSGIHIRD